MYPRGYVYMLANRPRGTTYIGVTNDIARRLWEHREGIGSAFARRYRLRVLVHLETFARIDEAIAREKQLKAWHRPWKWDLIEASNPEWRDLSGELNA